MKRFFLVAISLIVLAAISAPAAPNPSTAKEPAFPARCTQQHQPIRPHKTIENAAAALFRFGWLWQQFTDRKADSGLTQVSQMSAGNGHGAKLSGAQEVAICALSPR